MSRQRTVFIACLVLAAACVALPVWAESRGTTVSAGSSGGAAGALEPVQGHYCFTLGDGDTPKAAKAQAQLIAQEQAVKSYRVYVQSASTVKNFQLENDVIQTVSAGMLQNVQAKIEEKGREYCATVTATINPLQMEDLIQKQIKTKEVAQQVQRPLLAAGSAFGLRLWLNKPDGGYVEGDTLVVSVQSDRTVFLRVDYYQADRNVVHLVPNLYRSQTQIKAGQTYSFGGPGAQEKFTIAEPYGAEVIKAIACTQDFEDPVTRGRKMEDSLTYNRDLRGGTRGVKVEGGEMECAEAVVGLTTRSQKVVDYTMTRGLRKAPAPPDPSKPTSITGGIGSRPEEAAPRP